MAFRPSADRPTSLGSTQNTCRASYSAALGAANFRANERIIKLLAWAVWPRLAAQDEESLPQQQLAMHRPHRRYGITHHVPVQIIEHHGGQTRKLRHACSRTPSIPPIAAQLLERHPGASCHVTHVERDSPLLVAASARRVWCPRASA